MVKKLKLLFKQRIFSWLDSYDIYDEQGKVVYTVEGKLSWGHRLVIYNTLHEVVGELKEEVITWLAKFHMLVSGIEIGMITKEFSVFKPKFHLSCNDWTIVGDFMEWNYDVVSEQRPIMHVSKELLHLSDTYVLDIEEASDALYCLMIVLAIDAVKCA